ncbi:endopeptidase IV [Legionella jordanis]|uniref:endopeptidase IV n=1 Tax=Legionella jordanis TaxID=456 RepID=UPI000EFE6D4E|nr:endopeptidase IV [Legionella jordanis]RMX22101.1 endopeptidase IV [Legionella jordanis]
MKTKTQLKKSLLLLSALCVVMGAAEAKKSTADKDPQAVKEADNMKNPIGCYDTGYQFDLKTLHLLPSMAGKRQSLYFIFNALNQPVNLYQMRDGESSRSLYLNHSINARQWAGLSTTEKKVKFICTVPEAKNPYGKIVDCAESLKVCEYTNVRYGLNNRGNFWIVNSNDKNGAIRDVVHYGVIPGM